MHTIDRETNMSSTRSLFEIDANGIGQFAEDVQYMWCQSSYINEHAVVTVLDEPPSALEFLRDFVSVSRPCIIRNAVSFRFTVNELVERCPQIELVVDVSPDGHADVLRHVREDEDGSSGDSNPVRTIFVQPEQRVMTVEAFHQQLIGQSSHRRTNTDDSASLQQEPFSHVFSVARKRQLNHDKINNDSDSEEEEIPEENDGVFYYSRQNDCLRQELSQFWESTNNKENELPRTFDWAEQAFGTGPPQAVNLWMGNERSVSSMHKDHYENLFYVASGEKVFTLCPPADAPFLYEQEYGSGRFHWNKEQQTWNVQLLDEEQCDSVESGGTPPRAHWIAADVTRKDHAEYLHLFPLLRFTHPIKVKVKEGELLYIPALWFHRVTQTCETVGVNYWYDMKFESPLWTFFHLLQQLKPTAS